MPPEIVLLFILILAITLYALFGGADFGAGIWEFNTALQAPKKERDLIYKAIGPVWEANHVWLIFAIVILHTAFPIVFAALSRALWIPLLFALLGIFFRGAAYAFRTYAVEKVKIQELWGAIFALTSTAAPFFLGASLGAIASGELRFSEDGSYLGNPITGWVNSVSIFGAFFGVGVCSYLSAVYLTREARQIGDQDLENIWRKRALVTGMWMGILALVGIALVASDNPVLWQEFKERAWPLVGLSMLFGTFSLIGLWKRKLTLTVLTSGVAVATVIWGLAYAQYPFLIPQVFSISETKAPESVLEIMIWIILFGSIIILPALAWLFYLFKFPKVEV